MPLKLNTDTDGRDLAKKQNVTALPTIIFFDSKGNEISRFLGFRDGPAFEAEIKRVLETARNRAQLEDTLKAKPADPEANAKIAYLHALDGKADDALQALQKAESGKYKGPYLALTQTAIGMLLQKEKKHDEAIPYFELADKSAKSLYDKAHARYRLLESLVAKGDKEKIKKAARDLNTLKIAPENWLKYAKEKLNG